MLVGCLGVLIGIDSWYLDIYVILVEQGVELLVIFVVLNQSGCWQQFWFGFDVELVLGDVCLVLNSLSNVEVWQCLVVGECLLVSGVCGVVVVFVYSCLWNVIEDG